MAVRVSPKLLHVLCWVPLLVIGLASMVLGSLWLALEVPWVEERIIHSFSGLWLLALGAMICAYVLVTLMGTRRARNTLLAILGILFVLVLYLEVRFIPFSPLVIFSFVLAIPYLVSLWASLKLNAQQK